MRSAPSLCSAATAHYAPASTLFSSPTPPSTQIQRSTSTPLSFLKPALAAPCARSVLRASFHLVLFLHLHARLKFSAQLRHHSLFSTPRLLHPALFLSYCSLSASPRSLRTAYFFHIALFHQPNARLKLSAQPRRPRFPHARSLFSPPRSLCTALFLSPCSLFPTPPSTPTQCLAQRHAQLRHHSLSSSPRLLRPALFRLHCSLPPTPHALKLSAQLKVSTQLRRPIFPQAPALTSYCALSFKIALPFNITLGFHCARSTHGTPRTLSLPRAMEQRLRPVTFS